jgi:hypothetical protein
MNHLRFLLLVLFTLQIIVAVPPSPAYIALYRHNQYRLKHRVPPLKWNYQLAMHAQYWAEQCYLGHSSVAFLEFLLFLKKIMNLMKSFAGDKTI